MKYFILIFIIFFTNCVFARTALENQIFKENPITLKNFNGYYPTFKDKKYANINKSIKHFIHKELYDKKNDEWLMPVADYTLLYHNKKFIVFSIDYSLGGASGNWFNKYYTIDKKTKKQVVLFDYLKHKNIKRSDINKALNNYIKPCLKGKKLNHCQFREIETLLSQNKTLNIKNNSGFYISKNNNIHIAFNSHLLTARFEYNPKTKKIIPQAPQ